MEEEPTEFGDHPPGGSDDMITFSSSEEEDVPMDLPIRIARSNAVQYIAETQATAGMLIDSSSDEEDPPKWGGSRPGKAPNKSRDFARARAILYKQYFSGEDSIYNEVDFERRFRMPRAVFMKVKEAVIGEGPFKHHLDGRGKPGIDPVVRLTACLRRMACGTSSDFPDEKFEISESVMSRDCPILCRIVKEKLGQYLNTPPTEEIKTQVQLVNAARGFPGMFASWDCKHFPWEMCPTALHGQHKSGAKPSPSLVLEAIADPHLYIWYHHFGEPGSLNDINQLDKSSIVTSILDGSFDLHTQPYRINNAERDYLYFLVDGIYPPWAIFIDTIANPQDDKEKHFAAVQEGNRKDIERAFGVIVKQWQILQRPIRQWYLDDIKSTMDFCIILHNMVVEHHRNDYTINEWVRNVLNIYGLQNNPAQLTLFGTNQGGLPDPAAAGPGAIELRANRLCSVYDNVMRHRSLKDDLVEHNWNLKIAKDG